MEVFQDSHLASQVCKRTGKKLVMRKGIKDDLGSISFPGCHMAADGSASLEDWIQESSCSQVLVLTAGVTGPRCTNSMPEINGSHCACMSDSPMPGLCPYMCLEQRVEKNDITYFKGSICKLIEDEFYKNPILHKLPGICQENEMLIISAIKEHDHKVGRQKDRA